MKRPVNVREFGFINVDKETGVSSSAIVNKIKWLSGVPCGHMGTLDPLASGVLPVGVGNATRLFDYFLEKKKEYVAEFTFGAYADTLDTTGVVEYIGRVPTASEVQKVLPSFEGKILQMPPKYSAKNVNGRRGYELARAGVEFELSPKEVEIYALTFLGEGATKNSYKIKVECGGGTYIRSLGRDIAEALSTHAVMSALRRTKSGVFTIEKSVKIADLTEENINEYLIPTESVLPFERLELTAKNRAKIFDGVAIETDAKDGQYKFYREGVFYGIATVENGFAKLTKKLC
ncbi:MAG: tRNA pseudouridine(55) synthase TruB [Clostridia bacterium]|nr:tRNA pseudouridine(55) synthase TruB [Clostridia bacterium]